MTHKATYDRVKVSIALTTYNHKNFIERSLQSVLMQCCDFPFEIVIGDDASTDGTESILRSYEKKYRNLIRYFRYPRRVGAHLNFNNTLRHCRGNYVAILDGDDYWTDSLKLARQAALMDSDPELGVSFHPVSIVDENDTLQRMHPPLAWCRSTSWEKLLAVNFIPFVSAMYRRSLIPKFPEKIHSLPFGDWWINLECARKGGIGFLPERMAAYRMHSTNSWLKRSPFEKALHGLRFLWLYHQVRGIPPKTKFFEMLYDQSTYFFYHLTNYEKLSFLKLLTKEKP